MKSNYKKNDNLTNNSNSPRHIQFINLYSIINNCSNNNIDNDDNSNNNNNNTTAK